MLKSNNKAIIKLISLLDKGFIATILLYLPSEFSCDPQREDDNRLHAALLDLELDPAKLEPDSYLEIERCQGQRDGICQRNHWSPKFYTGTAWGILKSQPELQHTRKIQLLRIYRHSKISTEQETTFTSTSTAEKIEGGGSLVEGVEAAGHIDLQSDQSESD